VNCRTTRIVDTLNANGAPGPVPGARPSERRPRAAPTGRDRRTAPRREEIDRRGYGRRPRAGPAIGVRGGFRAGRGQRRAVRPERTRRPGPAGPASFPRNHGTPRPRRSGPSRAARAAVRSARARPAAGGGALGQGGRRSPCTERPRGNERTRPRGNERAGRRETGGGPPRPPELDLGSGEITRRT